METFGVGVGFGGIGICVGVRSGVNRVGTGIAVAVCAVASWVTAAAAAG